MDKKLINGLQYEKLSEDKLYDLSPWELVDIILAYRKDCIAKKQECEELKNELIDIKWNIEAQDIELNDKEEQLEAYKMEAEEGKEINAELKAENEKLKKLYEEVCSENLKEIYELIKKNDLWREIVNVVNGKLEKQLDQLKATLQEIKEIAEGVKGYDPLAKQILQKIKECEVEE